MTIETLPWGTSRSGEPIRLFRLQNEQLRAELLSYGATIRSLCVKTDTGWLDTVLGYETLREYEDADAYLGATIGRCANRIGGAQFELNGRIYRLPVNDGQNHHHGGVQGFDKRTWSAELLPDGVRFFRCSPDGEEGYPGNLDVSVTYRLQERRLHIDYEAQSDRDTLCSLTSHSYFNLNGSGDILRHRLQLFAEAYTPVDDSCLPTGEIRPVEGTVFDFREPHTIEPGFRAAAAAQPSLGGYDHNYQLTPGSGLRPAAEVRGEKSGLGLRILTTLPGLQFYTGNFLAPCSGMGGPQSALCLEPQFFPNAMACPAFEKPILRAGETYRHSIVLQFLK